MADEQQEEQSQSQSQSQPPITPEQSVTNNDMVQSVQELMCKDKSTVLVKAAQLLIANLQQQQVLLVLNQTLQEAIEQKEQMLKDLHDQPVMESLMNNIEAQNHSTRKQLSDKVESINLHMKSSEVLRKQLKKEIMNLRSYIDDAKRQMHEKEETGKSLQHAHIEIVARIEEGIKQLKWLSGERDKLRKENQEKMDKIKTMRSSCEENFKKLQAELAESHNVLKQRTEELNLLKKQVSGKIQACHQMVSEKHELQNRSDELKRYLEKEKSKIEQTFGEQQAHLDNELANKAEEYERKLDELNQKFETSSNTKARLEEKVTELDVAVSELIEEVNEVRNQNAKLENELINPRPIENLDSDSDEELTQVKPPVKCYSGRPRLQVFKKSDHVATSSGTDNDHEVGVRVILIFSINVDEGGRGQEQGVTIIKLKHIIQAVIGHQILIEVV
uniref:Uncharacterized protein n=1 Tax=Anopheles culicifacies TaxID=139723 RepID=A0A182MNB5_9DIPT